MSFFMSYGLLCTLLKIGIQLQQPKSLLYSTGSTTSPSGKGRICLPLRCAYLVTHTYKYQLSFFPILNPKHSKVFRSHIESPRVVQIPIITNFHLKSHVRPSRVRARPNHHNFYLLVRQICQPQLRLTLKFSVTFSKPPPQRSI